MVNCFDSWRVTLSSTMAAVGGDRQTGDVGSYLEFRDVESRRDTS